jgi:hypothetical protein
MSSITEGSACRQTPVEAPADEIVIAPEPLPILPADRIQSFLTENPPLGCPAVRPIGELQDALRHFASWGATRGYRGHEILVALLCPGNFESPRLGMGGRMSVAGLIEMEYQYRAPLGRDNQIDARRSATIQTRNAVWESPAVTLLIEFADHFDLTARMILEQANQAVATSAAGVFRRIGIAA